MFANTYDWQKKKIIMILFVNVIVCTPVCWLEGRSGREVHSLALLALQVKTAP